MISGLSESWRQIESMYTEERLNSERCLQAALYASMSRVFGSTARIFVEPSWDGEGMVPDLVICCGNEIRCVVEIKFTPHFWIPSARISSDLEKLQIYASYREKEVRLDYCGPRSRFDLKERKWQQPIQRFRLTTDALFVFAVISRREDRATTLDGIKKISPGIASIPGFVLLAAATDPDAACVEQRSDEFFAPATFA